MGSLRVEIANPDARLEKAADGVLWFCASDPRRPVDDSSVERAWTKAADELDDGLLIAVTLEDGTPREVRAFRSPASSYDIFFVLTDGGGLLLTDQFTHALAVVPPERRSVSRESLADHLLFRTVPGAHTYVHPVQRLGHGEEMVWHPGDSRVSRRVRRKLSGGDALSPRDALEAVDCMLHEVIRPLASLDAVENMLSGGVDSTLVHTYLGRSAPSVSAALTSDEFKFEVDYALRASALLGNRHRLVQLEEAAYLAELERCVDGMGLPPHHLQTVLLDAVFRSGGTRFITAQFADALFGLDVDVAVDRIWRMRWLWRLPARDARLVCAVSAARVRKASTLLRVGQELARPTDDPRGLALSFGMHTDVDMAVEILGADLVEQRLQARLEYVQARLDGDLRQRGSATSHLHAGHWVQFFCDETVSLWRQAAHARGRALHCPFTSRRLCETVLRIPSPDRYVRHGRTKHLLKDLLVRRLPAYPVDQRKGSSGLPFARFWLTGPLHRATERYPLPEFLEPSLQRRLVNEPGWLTWNLFTFALWEQRVLRQAAVPPPAIHVFDA
jgi:asparagine synthase (glutamine-hydrolysing)